jgi:hypothetical protein
VCVCVCVCVPVQCFTIPSRQRETGMRTLQGRGVWEADLRKWFIPPALLPYCRFRVLGFRFQIFV